MGGYKEQASLASNLYYPPKQHWKVMKRLFIFAVFGIALASCTFNDYDSEFDRRDRIVGHYDVEEYSETWGEYINFSIRITKGVFRNELVISNFYGTGMRVTATLSGDRIVIPLQVVDGHEIEGIGTVYGNEIRLSYSVKDLFGYTYTDFCESVAYYGF